MNKLAAGLDFYQALITHYESQKQEALGILKLYISNPLAVSDHSNFLEDMKKATEKLVEADESIVTLNNYFQITRENSGDPPSENPYGFPGGSGTVS